MTVGTNEPVEKIPMTTLVTAAGGHLGRLVIDSLLARGEEPAADLARGAETGQLTGSTGDGRVASATRADYADGIAAVLLEDGHVGQVYEFSGDHSWTFDELAATISEIVGRDVNYTHSDTAEHVATLEAAGLDAATAGFVAAIDTGIRDGVLADAAPVPASTLGAVGPTRAEGRAAHGRGVLRNMTSIRDRPAAVSDRIELGHWEGDLVMGRRPSAVATLVERVTRYVRIVPLPDGYKADAVRLAIADDLRQLPIHLRKTLTWDRGREMAAHQELAGELGLDVYFCDPHSPRQRGSNENTNRLLRQNLPKGADLTSFSLRELDDIAGGINHRPRRVLEWATAAELFVPHLLAQRVP